MCLMTGAPTEGLFSETFTFEEFGTVVLSNAVNLFCSLPGIIQVKIAQERGTNFCKNEPRVVVKYDWDGRTNYCGYIDERIKCIQEKKKSNSLIAL